MAGFDNDTMYADNVDFSGSATPAPTVTLDGQLLIGSTAAPNIRVATLIAGANITITNGAGTIQIDATGGGAGTVSGLTPDAFTPPGSSPVIPNGGGNIIVTGAQIPASNLANVIQTNSLAANTMTIEIQVTNSTAVSTPADNGVSHFDSGIFTVGAGGFVSLGGGNVPPAQKFDVDANTGPGTDPVVPTALGVVTITGAQVAAGVVGTNVIRTDSLAANAYTIEVQRTTTAAVSTVADNGVSHFDNTIFTADGNGFISLVGGPVPPTQKFDVDANTVPGTDPVVADGSGVVTVTGAQVASGTVGTNVIRTNSVAANAYRIEIQRSTAVAGTDPTKNGVAHFNSAQFSVDANAFVSIVGTSSLSVVIQAFTSSGTYTPTAGLKYCIVEICGGGGGGGGVSATAAGQVSAAGGGGGGGYSRGVYSNATIGASQVVTIGAGGAGGTSGGGIGSTGGTSSLGALQTASGGGGGNGSIAGATSFENGGGGGLGTLGSINIPGQSGLAGWGIATTLNTVCGAGGASFFGTGGVGSVHTLGTVGGDGGGYGGGGGGAANAPSQVSGHAGGNGTSGVILITEFI